jgi:hypothetical protein
MADLTDKHYALFANNQHPLQLSLYEEYNRFLRMMHDKGNHENMLAFEQRFQQAIDDKEKLINTKEGETLSMDDLSDIYVQVMGDQRARQNMTLTTKSKTGEINDYLEVRRPFGAAQ